MKKLFYVVFIFSIIIFSRCYSVNKIETDIYECFIDAYNDKEIDYEQNLQEFEELLIEKNILEDNSGNSYYKALSDFYKNPSLFNLNGDKHQAACFLYETS